MKVVFNTDGSVNYDGFNASWNMIICMSLSLCVYVCICVHEGHVHDRSMTAWNIVICMCMYVYVYVYMKFMFAIYDSCHASWNMVLELQFMHLGTWCWSYNSSSFCIVRMLPKHSHLIMHDQVLLMYFLCTFCLCTMYRYTHMHTYTHTYIQVLLMYVLFMYY